MGKKVVNESSLTAVADAIRERAGTTKELVFPEGFVSAVEGIPDYMELRMSGQLTEYRNETYDGIVLTGAFRGVTALKNVYLPKVSSLRNDVFRECTALEGIKLESCSSIGNNVFMSASAFEKADFHKLSWADGSCFTMASALKILILRNETKICTLNGTSAFNSTPIKSGTGYIYVPRKFLSDTDANSDYRRATNWSTFASQFRALEDYTVDGTTTGELDESKI
jgi:hypothetical protein